MKVKDVIEGCIEVLIVVGLGYSAYYLYRKEFKQTEKSVFVPPSDTIDIDSLFKEMSKETEKQRREIDSLLKEINEETERQLRDALGDELYEDIYNNAPLIDSHEYQ